MNAPLLQELIEAVTEGLARPQHYWAVMVIVVAIAGGWLFGRGVQGRARRRIANLASTWAPGVAWRSPSRCSSCCGAVRCSCGWRATCPPAASHACCAWP